MIAGIVILFWMFFFIIRNFSTILKKVDNIDIMKYFIVSFVVTYMLYERNKIMILMCLFIIVAIIGSTLYYAITKHKMDRVEKNFINEFSSKDKETEI